MGQCSRAEGKGYKGKWKTLGMIDMFIILSVIMVSWHLPMLKIIKLFVLNMCTLEKVQDDGGVGGCWFHSHSQEHWNIYPYREQFILRKKNRAD